MKLPFLLSQTSLTFLPELERLLAFRLHSGRPKDQDVEHCELSSIQRYVVCLERVFKQRRFSHELRWRPRNSKPNRFTLQLPVTS